MKNKKGNTLQAERALYESLFGNESCPVCEVSHVTELDDAISDCKIMLDEAISRNNKEEISYWRKLLQENKVHRREILST